jgi:hypothetical protein
MDNSEYVNKVYGLLLSFSEEIIIEYKVHPDRVQTFIEVVKEFIRLDMSNDFYLEFSSDYKKIRKVFKLTSAPE